MAPYRKRIGARRKANPESAAWAILEKAWASLLQQARETLRVWESGRPCSRYAVQAARHLQSIGDAVPPADVVETALAVFMLWANEPHRLRSDRAFDHQLVRRVRSLADTSSGSYWNPKTQRAHRVYRDVAPKTITVLAHHLKATFGGAGAQLAALERSQANAASEERQRLQQAIAALR